MQPFLLSCFRHGELLPTDLISWPYWRISQTGPPSCSASVLFSTSAKTTSTQFLSHTLSATVLCDSYLRWYLSIMIVFWFANIGDIGCRDICLPSNIKEQHSSQLLCSKHQKYTLKKPHSNVSFQKSFNVRLLLHGNTVCGCSFVEGKWVLHKNANKKVCALSWVQGSWWFLETDIAVNCF